MHEENPFQLLGSLRLDSQDGQSLCMVGSEPASQVERRSRRSTAPADRGDAIREIAANLERLCIEYACQSRVNGVGNETRAVWAQFKAQIEALRGMA